MKICKYLFCFYREEISFHFLPHFPRYHAISIYAWIWCIIYKCIFSKTYIPKWFYLQKIEDRQVIGFMSFPQPWPSELGHFGTQRGRWTKPSQGSWGKCLTRSRVTRQWDHRPWRRWSGAASTACKQLDQHLANTLYFTQSYLILNSNMKTS